MLGSLVISIAAPQAFGSRALPFILGYVGLQIMRNAFIVSATKPETPLHVAFRRILDSLRARPHSTATRTVDHAAAVRRAFTALSARSSTVWTRPGCRRLTDEILTELVAARELLAERQRPWGPTHRGLLFVRRRAD
jgi:hypothetical protein